jgi:hypothetical protein
MAKKEKSNSTFILGLIAMVILIAACLTIGYEVGKPANGKANSQTVVSVQPIPLVSLDLAKRNITGAAYIRNAAGGNTAQVDYDDFTWISQAEGTAMYDMELDMMNIGPNASATVYFPNRINIDWIVDDSAEMALDGYIDFWVETDFPNFYFNLDKYNDSGVITTYIDFDFNTTQGIAVYAFNFTDADFENVTGTLVYYNFIFDPATGEISLIARDANACSKKDVLWYDSNAMGIIWFTGVNVSITEYSSGNVGYLEIGAYSDYYEMYMKYIGITQNPLNGIYEGMTQGRCQGDYVW